MEDTKLLEEEREERKKLKLKGQNMEKGRSRKTVK